ncbi:unnamed protein product [Mytilus edulis]|uniref:Mab-21-like nucleotidyltransferase domain-containing protein n=1 Tax=Mytilus edulis TaxID=6550 RepID=A0A8S3QLV9_MYTED|nr:unnamed protein product [Mytilus edulis]
MATKWELNRKFQTFYHDYVKMDKEETKINSRVVRNIVMKILEYVNRLDPKFKKYPQKVSNADEFDFSILYDTGIVHKEIHTKTQDKGPKSVTENGFLVPLKFKRHLEKLVRDAFEYLTNNFLIDQKVEVEDLSDSPAVTIIIGTDDLSVDLAPMVNVRLPFKDEFDWPQHGAQWPAQEKFNN